MRVDSSSTIHKYPDYPRVAVSGIVEKDGAFLMVERRNPPAINTWAPPGGSVRLGETVFDAVRREVLEETRICVEPQQSITHVDAIYKDPQGRPVYHYVILYVLATYVSGEVQAGDDARHAGWFTLEELENMNCEKKTMEILRALNAQKFS